MKTKWALLLLFILNHTALNGVAAAHVAEEIFEPLIGTHPHMGHVHDDAHGDEHQHAQTDSEQDDGHDHRHIHVHPSYGECNFASLGHAPINASQPPQFIATPSLYSNLSYAPPVPPPNA